MEIGLDETKYTKVTITDESEMLLTAAFLVVDFTVSDRCKNVL